MMQPKSAQSQSRAEPSAERSTAAAGSSSSASGPAGTSSQPSRVPTSYVSIDVIPDPGTPPLRLPSLSPISSSPRMPPAIPSTLASFVPTPSSPTSPSSASGMGLGLNASGPRVLRHIDPTVTFMSRAALQAYSSFKVMKVGAAQGQPPIHSETTELELLSSSCMPGSQWSSEIECTFLYRTPFVPRYWDTLCRTSGEYMRRYLFIFWII